MRVCDRAANNETAPSAAAAKFDTRVLAESRLLRFRPLPSKSQQGRVYILEPSRVSRVSVSRNLDRHSKVDHAGSRVGYKIGSPL